MFLTPTEGMKKMFTGVRENLKKKGLPKPADDLFAFMPLVAVGETEEEALKFVQQVFWYVTNNKSEPQFRAPPGYVETELYANFLSGKFSGGRTDAIRTKGMEYFRENGVAVYGTPDQVVKQLKKMYKEIGGFGNLIAMLHSGDMPYKDVAKSMTLFAKEVVPQLKDLGTVSSKIGMLKDRGRPVPAKNFKGRTDALLAARAKSGFPVITPKKSKKKAA
jgi:alkanesulfonate monooxygenase SsuD/methylene tetrahydromethanopterin reductase-like flavin-dependent oxidoreductase (luciferase family)